MTMRKYNFSAGPAALPDWVLEHIKEDLMDWGGRGSSVMEVSHRGKDFLALHSETLSKLRSLLGVPDSHQILIMPGGATAQFSAVPLNLASEPRALYFISGHWARKAAQLAGKLIDVELTYDCGRQPVHIPPQEEWNLTGDYAYFHYCHNETVDGISFARVPDLSEQAIPVVADISSCVAAQPFDLSKIDLAYACAQKNLGIAGITLVIINEELLTRSGDRVLPVLNYRRQAEAGSLLNTPVTFAIYVCGLVCDWLIAQGGVEAMANINRGKAQSLYDLIDSSNGFYQANAVPENRSITNIVFHLKEEGLNDKFLAESSQAGLLYLKGHRARGGMRASIYNAVSEEAVGSLRAFMTDFANRYG